MSLDETLSILLAIDDGRVKSLPMKKEKNHKSDPQYGILAGHGAFGVDYIPKSKRARVIEGKVYAGKTSELALGKAKAIPLDRFTIALFHTADGFYAIKDACPHADYPLSKSLLTSDHMVICSSHNWGFDIRDGRCVKIGKCGHVGRALKVRTFPVEIKGEDIWVVVENS
jgi:nitrite reductase/ring-hydroxylating ferredoxin subunit